MNPKPLQPDPTEVDVRAVRSVAYTLLRAELSDLNCSSWDVANSRLHNLGRDLMEALGDGEDDAHTKVTPGCSTAR